MFTAWFVAQLLLAYVLPAKSVPPLDVLNKPIFDMFCVLVTNESALANVAVRLSVFDVLDVAAVKDALTSASPSKVVSPVAGAPPVPRAAWVKYLLPAMLPKLETMY